MHTSSCQDIMLTAICQHILSLSVPFCLSIHRLSPPGECNVCWELHRPHATQGRHQVAQHRPVGPCRPGHHCHTPLYSGCYTVSCWWEAGSADWQSQRQPVGQGFMVQVSITAMANVMAADHCTAVNHHQMKALCASSGTDEGCKMATLLS